MNSLVGLLLTPRLVLAACSRVPKSRMFQTFISVVLQKRKPLTSQGSYKDDGRPLNEVIDAIITRRLRKLEGLRAYLRRFLVSYGAQTNASTAFYVASTESPSDTLRSPVTRLSTQQSFLIGKLTWTNIYRERISSIYVYMHFRPIHSQWHSLLTHLCFYGLIRHNPSLYPAGPCNPHSRAQPLVVRGTSEVRAPE